MPNWCSNTIEVRGKNEDLERFKAAVTGPEGIFDFNVIVPEPVTYEPGGVDADGKYDAGTIDSVFPDWYNWRVANWGTKWNIGGSSFNSIGLSEWNRDEYGGLTYEFDTAWGPCEPIVATLAAQWPQLHFGHSWDEPGMNFGGYRVYSNGVEERSENGESKSWTWAAQTENELDDVAWEDA